MAQTIVIEQGDKDLQDVTKITPDTRVNQKAVIKYPATDLNNGMTAETWTEDETTFTNPHAITPAEESGDEEDGA
jgi:hypothetical protein